MRKLNWAILGDTHLGVRSDSKIFHRIQREFFEKQFFPYLLENNIKTVITLGDFFDRRKFINYETLKLAKEIFFDRTRDLGINVYMIVGNHDVYYKNTNKVNSVELLVQQSEYPNVQVYSDPETILIDQVKVLMMPWINSENYEKTIHEIKSSDARFVVSHLEMRGFEYFRGVISDHGHLDADLLARFEQVWTGHFHTRSSKGNIHYLGTPYEMNWSDYNDPKGFHHFDGTNLTFIENHEKVFIRLHYNDLNVKKTEDDLKNLPSFEGKYLKLIIKNKKHSILFERYLDAILETSPTDVNIIDETNKVLDVSEEENAPSDTMEIIEKFINENLETQLTKSVILDKIRKMYYLAKETSDDE